MRMKNLTNKQTHQRTKNRTVKRSIRIREQEQSGNGHYELSTTHQSGNGLKQEGLGLRSLIDSLVADGDTITLV
jgi:hypothetical protein